MEKLYTVEDIASMFSLTSRTIRNYLKDGILKGRKIGGQWRFTEEELKNFMDNATLAKDIMNRHKQDVLDFIDGVNTDLTGEIQTCTIIDIYEAIEIVNAKRDKLGDFINTAGNELNPNYMRFSYEYIESESKGRIILFAPPQYLIEALKILQ